MNPLQTDHGLKTPPPFADHPAGTGSERAPLHVSGGNPVQRQPGKCLGALQSRWRSTRPPSSPNRLARLARLTTGVPLKSYRFSKCTLCQTCQTDKRYRAPPVCSGPYRLPARLMRTESGPPLGGACSYSSRSRGSSRQICRDSASLNPLRLHSRSVMKPSTGTNEAN